MSYLVYVTRANHTFDTKEHPILESEWLAVSTRDASLHHNLEQYYARRGQSGEEEIIHPWVWSEHPDGEEILFWFEDGALHSKNADDFTIEKMYELAVQLNAKVLDGDDRVYDQSESEWQSESIDGDLDVESDFPDEPSLPISQDTSRQTSRKPWWRSFFGK